MKKCGITALEWLASMLNEGNTCGLVGSLYILSMYKGKCDKYSCSNSRGITLLGVIGEMYESVPIKEVWKELNE